MARMPMHPGEHLAEELDALSMSAAALARQLDVWPLRYGRPRVGEAGV